MPEDTGMRGALGALASKVNFKISCLKDVMSEYEELKHVIDEVGKEKEMLQQEKERLQHEQQANAEAFAAMKDDLLASKYTLIAARDALTASTDAISRKNNELEVLKTKLQECVAKNNQAQQQCGSVTETIQPRGVQTRSMKKRKRQLEAPLGYGADENEYTSQLVDGQSLSHLESTGNRNVQTRSVENQKSPSEIPLVISDGQASKETEECQRKELESPTVGQTSGVLVSEEDDPEVVRNELIKGFLEIDNGGRKIGIKEMGELSEKAFRAACFAKVPPEEVATAFYKLYSLWQKQLGDLSWYPFKTVTIDGKHQEIVNTDDDKLQELKMEWGPGAHDAVITALVEMKEYDRLSDRSIAYELWNYKERRRATTRECAQYMSNQVKQLSVANRRKNRRSSGRG